MTQINAVHERYLKDGFRDTIGAVEGRYLVMLYDSPLSILLFSSPYPIIPPISTPGAGIGGVPSAALPPGDSGGVSMPKKAVFHSLSFSTYDLQFMIYHRGVDGENVL